MCIIRILIDTYTHNVYSIIVRRLQRMKFKEIEKIILDDGWYFKKQKGSHCHYKHPTKSGKVTIPEHAGDVHPDTIKSILKQAGLN